MLGPRPPGRSSALRHPGRQYAATRNSPGDTPRGGHGIGEQGQTMCGIAGLLDPGWSGTAERTRAARSRHGPAPGPPGARRRRHLVRRRCRGGLRSPPVSRHRPVAGRPPAHGLGRWPLGRRFNGECYNAAELRAALPDGGRSLRGHCDTEVVVEAVAAWGLRPTLERLDAMFALALWDRPTWACT